MPPPTRPSGLVIGLLVAGMLVTGASNSLWSKWQDMQCVANCSDPDPARRKLFEQPTIQTAQMFIGETGCLLAFLFLASRFNPFRPPARPVAPLAARKAALASHAARLGHAPLSRPDESAIFFNESDISLLNDAPARHDRLPPTVDEPDQSGQLLPWSKAVLFWTPALCDILGTTFMNIGLLYVPVSVYQMVRGMLVLWVGTFSVIFLKRRLSTAQWVALGTVVLGVAVVGLSTVVGQKEVQTVSAEEEAGKNPVVGILLIVIAQLFTASQFVIEEKIMERHSVEPLLAVGYEGSYGFATTFVGMIILHLVIGRTPAGRGGYFDAVNGWHEVIDFPVIWSSSIAIMISIGLFNFCGLAVTKSISATARSTIDTSRTCLIWVVSMFLGWEHFKWLQILGFGLLVYGTFVFNGISHFPAWTRLHQDDVPTITLSDDADLDEDTDSGDEESGRSRSVRVAAETLAESNVRPAARRAGSGRRGEASPLLKNTED